jgi:hypothetical protein
VRVPTQRRRLLGLGAETVIWRWELSQGPRPVLQVWVRSRVRRRGRCGRCGATASWYDQGGGERRWRHLDVGFTTCELLATARRVDCAACGPTVAEVAWARHDSAFSRAFELRNRLVMSEGRPSPHVCGFGDGEVVAAKLGADPVNRQTENVGTVAGSPTPVNSQLAGGQVHRRLLTPRRGGP